MPFFRTARLLLALGAVGCGSPIGPQGGTDVGNGRTLQLDFRGYDAGALSKSLTLDSGVLVETAYIAVERIRFEPLSGASCEETPDSTEIDIHGPIVANLAGDGVLGQLPSFDTPSGSFCQLKVQFRPIDLTNAPPETPAELDGLSLRVSGERVDGTSFVVQSEFGDAFELRDTDGDAIELPPGRHPLFVAYELSSWIDALDLDTLGPGPIVIDKTQNADRLDAFQEAVKNSARLVRDADDDGELSAIDLTVDNELAD